jgi:uncharacterized protein (DUF934 family)
MTTLIRLGADGPALGERLPEGAFRPGPAPRPLPSLAVLNAGQGDVRAGIRPNVAWPEAPQITRWEGGALVRLADVRAGAAGPCAVVLMPHEDPLALAPFFPRLALIALELPKFSDGRSYSSAALLRRAGWAGELRAVGDVLIDQLFALARVGFDSFALRGDQAAERALGAFATFPFAYQADAPRPAPLRKAS